MSDIFKHLDKKYNTPVNPYEHFGHYTHYGIEDRDSYAKVHNAPNTVKARSEYGKRSIS